MSFMQTPHAKSPAPSPLEILAGRLDSDMRAVNALILEHMNATDAPLIPRLAQYLIAAGGKRIRPLLTLAAAQMHNAPMEKAYYLAAAVEFIHTATLLHDDVVDESQERRGQASANRMFGNQASVLVGDFLFSKAFQLMVEAQSLDVLRILADAAAVIAKGEVLQLSTANDITTDIAAYMHVIDSKTAALFAAACEVGPILGQAPCAQADALRDYGRHIGIAFQVVDDILDYAADTKTLGKEIGDDFREGKMTAPVIFALRAANEQERAFWARTIGEKNQKPDDFEMALKIIHRHNAIDASKDLARNHVADARKALKPAPEGPWKDVLLDLAGYVMDRHF